jgi:hypothetical protein
MLLRLGGSFFIEGLQERPAAKSISAEGNTKILAGLIYGNILINIKNTTSIIHAFDESTSYFTV